MILLGGASAWGQTDYSGVYYIGSHGYVEANTTTNYYLCPTENWYNYQSESPYYRIYSSETDNGQPFMTTYQCRNGVYSAKNAVWIVEKQSNSYYHIKRAIDGKYLTYNDAMGNNSNKGRMRLHLQSTADGDNALFQITYVSGSGSSTIYDITTKNGGPDNANRKYVNVTGSAGAGNQPSLQAASTKKDGPSGIDVGGIIGLWTSGASGDVNCRWYLEKATVDAPTITNNFDGTFTITAASGTTIYYTTNGDTPTTSTTTTGTTSVNVPQTESMTVIKTIAKGAGDYFPSGVTTYELPKCEKPVITISGGNVTITCATEGVAIHYTTDGSPATSSSATYTTPFAKGSATTFRAIATKPGYVNSNEATLLPPAVVSSSSQITDMSGNYILASDFSSSASIGTSENPFTGTIDGNFNTLTLSYPLVAYADGATIKNIILKDIELSGGTNVGAICNEARGATRIYNCGILGILTETKDNNGKVISITSTSTISGSGNVGGIVGTLSGNARVINCYSYANITGGTVAGGIVGNNTTTAINQDNVGNVGMVVNCMFYGDITGVSVANRFPVYGGNSINNDTDKGVNPYCYFRKNATFDDAYTGISDYNRSWPAEEKNLTRFEYYRSILNSNRKLCTWWVNGTNETAPTDDDVSDVGIAKWVLDPSIAPYPILKPWGKYPSVINIDPDNRFNPKTKTWESRNTAKEWEGKSYGTLSVTIYAGAHGSGSSSRDITITDMDTLNCDYGYYKIQLPYYNEVFGNPNGNTWNAKYGGNYGEYVVTGWDISGGNAATDYNFADRSSYKDRVYAQGGYFYVPEGVESISITAHWGKAVYLANRGYSIDRVKVTAADYKADKAFASAGTVPNTFQGQTVYDDLQNAIKALGTNSDYPTVYDQAIVLIGNHQVKNGSNKDNNFKDLDVSYALDGKWHPFTMMSADLDFDNEPDNCLQLQFRRDIDRPGIQPIRFDFLPIIELGLAVRHDNKAYAIGIMVPQGHFEVTETAFMRTTQFEYDGFQKTSSTARIESKSPVILNGGEFEMFTVRYHHSDRTSYFLLGGNAWVHRFAPGAHPNKGNSPSIYLCPINVIGGQVKELYLTGLYRPELSAPSGQGAPRCYMDGGKFDIVAGAGYEKVEAGANVTFKINHSKIDEFYGGGINGSNPISGDIDVTINNSMVDKYCGGPKVGNMTGHTVSTNATGTTFGVFYGGGNGGNSYYRQLQRDGDMESSHIGTWTGDWNWTGFNPLGKYDDDIDSENKGYHAEYEFEVFNQSNGVSDQITQRGFIKWIQFGITSTGNVSNTLENCKVTGNFYGGGNLATVNGNVSSTLTNTQVSGSVFGAGFSAAIPTFQVQDKESKTFPSIDFAGTITDGNIPYAATVYEWTNEKLEGKDEAYMKANPTYSKEVNGETKWYCYTWNSLANLGTVTGDVTLTIDGHTTLTDGKVMTVAGSIYGGGEESAVGGATTVSVTGGTIGAEGQGGVEYGNVYGGGKGKRDDVKAGLVKGSTNVSISGSPRIYHNVYGGGAYGSVGDFEYDNTTGMPTGLKTGAAANSGKTEVIITGGTFGWNGKENGMVFGSSRGDVGAPGSIEDQMAWVYDTEVKIGTSGSGSVFTTPTIKGSVYGGGENGHNFNNANVNIYSGTIGIPTGTPIGELSGAYYPYRGNVYGGGCGTDMYYTDPTGVENPYDGNGDAYNSLAGIVRGTATVNISGGYVVHNVYGAGAMGSVGNADDATSGKTTVNITGGRIGYDGERNGNVFGAARGEYGISTVPSNNLANVRESEVIINYATTPTADNEGKTEQLITGSVFGGGESGLVKESVAVSMTGGMILKDIYGGGALADTQTSNWDASANSGTGGWAAGKTSASSTTTVRLTGGTILGEAYGGGLGESGTTEDPDGKPAYVYGNVLVDLNGTTSSGEEGTAIANDARGCAVHQVFGCNNANGTPTGEVLVHVYATQNKAKSQVGNTNGNTPVTDAKTKGSYDVLAVYGGGNLAAYKPAGGKNTTHSTNVIIDGCGTTSIQQVYGGGNAASTPSTKVTVNGTYEIEEVFGGGNGKDAITVNNVTKPNPGANVGFYAYEDNVEGKTDTKENRATYYGYGSGAANVNIFGGTIHRVFGGSNTKGNVRYSAVTMLEDQNECAFCVDEAYGGGKSAPMDAEAKLLMACIPGLKNAYGGAEAADIQGNVTLNISNGTFDRVFGGNNLSGTISGSITVNVEEVGCKPVIIGELYGGGNQAGYSVYGYNSDGSLIESGTTPLYSDPQVNVKSFTSIGNIYGGGYGSGAKMVGNPTVNVNVANGKWYNDNVSVVGENAKTPNNYPIPSHAKGKIGAINNVFGGGNAAMVKGNTLVNIGTLSEVYVVKDVTVGDSVTDYYTPNNDGTYSAATGTAVEGTTYYEKKDVLGVDIRGNVYGGGNNAEVTGNADVQIGKKTE